MMNQNRFKFKSFRSLTAVLLMLLPMGVGAQTLTVGGIDATVAEELAEAYGDHVTFNSSTNTLTLDGATISGNTGTNGCITSQLESLTIVINGENLIESYDSCTAIRAASEGAQTLIISKGSDNSSLAFSTEASIRDFNSVSLEGMKWNKGYTYGWDTTLSSYYHGYRLMESDNKEAGVDNETRTMPILYGSDVVFYDLWVGGSQVSSINADAITGRGISDNGTVSFNATSNTLTLTNTGIMMSDLGGYPILSGLSDLTIKLLGSNEAQIYSDNLYLVKYSGEAASPKLTFLTDWSLNGQKVLSLGTLEVMGTSSTTYIANGYTVQNDFSGNSGWTITPNADNDSFSISFEGAYQLSVAGTLVTDANKDDVLGDGKVSFSSTGGQTAAVINTLTLNGATISAPIKTGLSNLTLDIQGTNTITTNGVDCIDIISGSSPSITFTSTSDPRGNLTLKNINPESTCGGVIASDFYDHITINKSVALLQPLGTYKLVSDTTHVAKFVPSYGLSIDDLPICEANANDVYGDGKVSFNKDTHTLTLNNASIGGISTSLSELDIDVIGNNSISMGSTGAVIQNPEGLESVAITVKSTAETKGCLSMYLDSNDNSNNGGSTGFLDNGVTLTATSPLQVSGDLTATYHAYVMISEPVDYDLYVGDVKVTAANASNITNELNNQDRPRATFDAETNTLTLDGIYYYWYWEGSKILVKSNISNLKVNLVGDNTVSVGGQKLFKYTGTGAETAPTITFLTEELLGTFGSLYVSGHTAINDLVDGYTITNEITTDAGTGWKVKTENSSLTLYYLESYGIIITKEGDDHPINSTNRLNVLNDEAGTVQFDGSNTLILNNANIDGITIGATNTLNTAGLKIYLKGNNQITNNEDKAVSNSGTAIPLYFATSTATDNSGTLTYTSNNTAMTKPADAFAGFSEVNYNDNLSAILTSNGTYQTVVISTTMQPIVTPDNNLVVVNGTDTNPEHAGAGLGADIEDIESSEAVSVVKNNILYVLNSYDGYFKEPNSDKVVLLNTYMGDQAVRTHVARPVNKKQLFPNTPSFSIYFKGMCFLVSAGSGQIVVEANTPQSGELHMMFGDEKYTVTKIPLGPTMTMYNVPYTFTKDTYVYLYSGVEASNVNASSRLDGSRRAPGRKMTTTTSIRRAGVRAASACSAPSPSLAPTTLTKDDVDDLIASAGDLSNGLTITGADYTDIADDAFESLASAKISYVDMRETGIVDQTIDRTKAPFSDVPAGSFIYMPVSNDIPVDADDNPILDNAKNVVIGSSCLNMLLPDDGTPFKAATDFSAGHTKMARTFTEGVNGTIYLPFAIDDKDELESHGTFYQMKSVEGTTITMESVESTKANVPYMFKPAKSEFEVDAVVNVETAIPDPDDAKVGDIAFIGTYQQQSLLSGSNDIYCFIGEGADAGKFVRVETAKVTINPFRGYLVGPASASPARFFNLNTGEATSISEKGIVNSEKFATATYFDLQGRRVLNPKKGIYILNGRKVIIK